MLTTLCNVVLIHSSHLTLAVLASPPPLDPTNLLTDIFNWLRAEETQLRSLFVSL